MYGRMHKKGSGRVHMKVLIRGHWWAGVLDILYIILSMILGFFFVEHVFLL